ncbi:cupin domain-containing protein [Antrihabitans sp. YC3-6]|uniref:Cupin domain-containing protein n=1 Tax=Antrihabitans stalagmiti TaxID=2799499 RepID=A0A934NMK9_9NOCA|nr:cupin domain-containing protein [Antrihabitans stalagmiti]MBJ8337959.1 cupin domain-containing protein [Antrihabitans stalagmiti]
MKSMAGSMSHFADDPRFTGDVFGAHIAPDGDPQLHAYVVSFQPYGRTAWHSHERGQLLICTAGQGFVGTRDGRRIELRPGVAVWTDAGEEHWHGAGPTDAMTHVAVQTETPDGASVHWHEQVSERDWKPEVG